MYVAQHGGCRTLRLVLPLKWLAVALQIRVHYGLGPQLSRGTPSPAFVMVQLLYHQCFHSHSLPCYCPSMYPIVMGTSLYCLIHFPITSPLFPLPPYCLHYVQLSNEPILLFPACPGPSLGPHLIVSAWYCLSLGIVSLFMGQTNYCLTTHCCLRPYCLLRQPRLSIVSTVLIVSLTLIVWLVTASHLLYYKQHLYLSHVQ